MGEIGDSISDAQHEAMVRADAGPETPFLIAHFQAARADILQKVQLRDRYVYFCGVSSGLVVYFAMTNNVPGILFLVPVIIWICALMFAQVEHIIGAQTWYLKTEYTDELKRLFGRNLPHWDSSYAATQFHAASAFRLRYAGVGSIFLIGSWAALAIRIHESPERFRFLSDTSNWFQGMLFHALALSDNPFLRAIQLTGVFLKNLWTNLFANYGVFPVLEVLVFVFAPIFAYGVIRGAAYRRAKRFAAYQDDKDAKAQERKLFVNG